MPATWVELRDFAKRLANQAECPEVEARASISRAYYAAFHALEPICRLVPDMDPPHHGTDGLGHGQIPGRLRNWRALSKLHPGLSSQVMTARGLALTYQAVLASRRMADYQLADCDQTQDAALLQLKRVQELADFAVQARTTLDRLGILASA